MNWEKAKGAVIVAAALTILSVYAPPIVVNPVASFISQLRENNVRAREESDGVDDKIVDSVSSAIKKALH